MAGAGTRWTVCAGNVRVDKTSASRSESADLQGILDVVVVGVAVEQVALGKRLGHNERANVTKLLLQGLPKALVDQLVGEVAGELLRILHIGFWPDDHEQATGPRVVRADKHMTAIREL